MINIDFLVMYDYVNIALFMSTEVLVNLNGGFGGPCMYVLTSLFPSTKPKYRE